MASKRKDTYKIEVQYTGGGIWISGTYIDNHHYYTVDNDTELLWCWDDREEEEPGKLNCQNCVWTKEFSELDPLEQAFYTILYHHMECEMH